MLIRKLTVPSPHGQITVTDEMGKVISEGDLLVCVHCHYTWMVQPGSGIKRGYCFKCGGPTCGREACSVCLPEHEQMERDLLWLPPHLKALAVDERHRVNPGAL